MSESGDIHQISLMLGTLSADVKSLRDGLEASLKHQAVNAKKIDELTTFKNKGAGLLLGVSLAAGGAGSALPFLWSYFTKGG